jgi:chitinase
MSKWGFCGHTSDYCGDGCQSGPCTDNNNNNDNNNNGDIINDNNFRCAFNNLDDGTRRQRLDGLKQSGWKPKNADEAAVFLAHVYHETDGLKTLVEYCAPGKFYFTNEFILKKIFLFF